MSELRELYQQVILDHGRHPRNFGPLPNATISKQGFNPLCGDKIEVHLKEHEGKIANMTFEGCGCAISVASASLLSECIKDKTISDILVLFDDFHALVTQGSSSDRLGKLTVLAGVKEYPARVKCATLAWHTVKAALTQDINPVSTE